MNFKPDLINRWGGRVDITQAYCHSSKNDLQKLSSGRMCFWCIESLSVFAPCLALHWQQQNHRGNRKGLSSLVLGRISSFGGVPPPLSLNSPSLYLFLCPPPPAPNHLALGVALAVWLSSGVYQRFLFICSLVIISERTMCWHGDEEDEDSSEVKCCWLVCLLCVFL